MEDLLHDLVNHNLQKRTVALMESGSWAPMSKKSMADILAPCKDLTVLEEGMSILCAPKDTQTADLDTLAEAIVKTI